MWVHVITATANFRLEPRFKPGSQEVHDIYEIVTASQGSLTYSFTWLN